MHFLCIFILIALSRCHELKDTKPIIKDTTLNYSFVGVIIAGNKNLHLYLFLRLYNCIIQSFLAWEPGPILTLERHHRRVPGIYLGEKIN